ncbi:MAG: hypothetical protein ACI9N3_000778 [Colwellia sp.]|jgi:hypothetical protein
MLFLFLGYELIQFFILLSALSHGNLTLIQIFIALFFSVIIDVIPVFGYFLGKKSGGKVISNWVVLFSLGAVIALIQSGLYEFGLLTPEQSTLSTLIAASLFFAVAFLPINNKKTEVQV